MADCGFFIYIVDYILENLLFKNSFLTEDHPQCEKGGAEMRDRVMGEEIEWTGGCQLGLNDTWGPIGDPFSFDKIKKSIFLDYEESASNSLIFLPNGSRIYSESAGGHLETALPECQSALEVLKFDKWSETFVCWVSKVLKERYDENLHFFKKNADSKLDTTRGCHENYFSEKIFETLLKASEQRLKNSTDTLIPPEINYFILFLITRQIFTGSGGIMLYSLMGENDIYEISPRTHFINAVISSSTTSGGSGGRSIINIRPETLTYNNEYWRNHLILGDANMADLSIFLKFGTTSAVIEMIEEGSWNDDLCLDNPRDAPKILQNISKDLTLKNVPIRLKNGKNYTALQIQKKFCNNWRRHIRETCEGGEKAEIASWWQEVLGRLEIDDESLYSQLDWKIKMRLIRNFMDRKGLPLNHEKVLNVDNLYHNPDPKISFYYKLKNRPNSNFLSLVSESEILEADKVPPNSRAKLRSSIKKILNELGFTCNVNWDLITFKLNSEAHEYKIFFPEPRLSSLSSLDLGVNEEAIKFLGDLKPPITIF